MHEIITLQLGQRSNYVATHFWNTQESYFTYSSDEESLVNHDIHFRPGLGADGTETFTPRSVIYDLKGGFGTLKKINALYELQEDGATPQGLWNGPTVIQRQAAIEQHAYQQSLEEGLVPPQLTTESVRYWSDFNRVYFHPKSIVQLDNYELGSTLMPFEKWQVGEELFDSLDKEHDVLDRDLRPFAEEADQLQGIQMVASLDDAWGGFAAKYMDRLRDEYGKTTIWVWGLEEGLRRLPREKQFLKLSNTARSYAEISPHASLFIPMTLPSSPLPRYLNLDTHSLWHISALYSTALESTTLPSRLRQNPNSSHRQTLDDIAVTLNVNGNQRIAKLQMSIGPIQESPSHQNGELRPGRLEVRAQSRDSRMPSSDGRSLELNGDNDDEESTLDLDFFPNEESERIRGPKRGKKLHVFGQADSARGGEAENNGVEEDEFDGRERARRRAAGMPIIHRTHTVLPFAILDSFPKIFSPVLSSSTSTAVSVRTSLSTDTSVASRIEYLRKMMGRSIALEEREVLGNALAELVEAYQEGWDSGSDNDGDDD